METYRTDSTALLFDLQDKSYADFQSKLLPTVPRETVIGVRTPDLRKLAKQLSRNPAAKEFLQSLPHRYFDENQLHAFILSEEKDFNTCIANLEQFLPYVDNWATCDQLSPRCFKKHTQELLPLIRKWMRSRHTYTKRFGIGTLMRYFLDDTFLPTFLPTHLPTSLDRHCTFHCTFQCTYLPTFLRACLRSFDYLFDHLSVVLSVVFWLLFCTLFCVVFCILSDRLV